MALPVVSGREAIKALCRAGFRVVRQRGSHVRLEKRTEDTVIKLTVPLHESLSEDVPLLSQPHHGSLWVKPTHMGRRHITTGNPTSKWVK